VLFSLFHLNFSYITYLTSYHWTIVSCSFSLFTGRARRLARNGMIYGVCG
jgi:hypothetical protein